ncbi:MAG: MOSC domain-containing protein, partial [Pseudomonadota bacterium]
HRFGVKGMVKTIIKTRRCGWYFRVLETGEVQAGDAMERVEQGHADWSVERVFACLIAGKATKDDLRELAGLERLNPGLRQRAEARCA